MEYEKVDVPKSTKCTDLCDGCIGQDNEDLCAELPECVDRSGGALKNFIFMKKVN